MTQDNYFKARRIALGLSQREMGRRAKVSNVCVAKWEAGDTVPTRTPSAQLAAAYKTTVAAIERAIMKLMREKNAPAQA